jgi:hypothetical protein
MPPKRKRVEKQEKKTKSKKDAKQEIEERSDTEVVPDVTLTSDNNDQSTSSNVSVNSYDSPFSHNCRRISLRGYHAPSSRAGGGGSYQEISQVLFHAKLNTVVCGQRHGGVTGYVFDTYNNSNASDSERLNSLMVCRLLYLSTARIHYF